MTDIADELFGVDEEQEQADLSDSLFGHDKPAQDRSVLTGNTTPAPPRRTGDPNATAPTPEDEALYRQYIGKLTSDDKPLSIGEYMRSSPEQREGVDRPVQGIESDVSSNLMLTAPLSGLITGGARAAATGLVADAAGMGGQYVGEKYGGEAGGIVGGLAGGLAGGMAATAAGRAMGAARSASAVPPAVDEAAVRARAASDTGQRGAAFIPGEPGLELVAKAREIQRTAREVADAATADPKLERFLLAPGQTVGDAAAQLRTANAATGKLAADETRSIFRDTPFWERLKAGIFSEQTNEAKAVRKYLIAADEYENWKGGLPIPSGRGPMELQDAMREAEQSIGKPRLDELVGRYREIDDASFDDLVRAKVLDPSSHRPAHVKAINIDKQAEALGVGRATGPGGVGTPGSAKQRFGFEGEREEPIRALALGRQQAEAAANTRTILIDPVLKAHSRNAAIRANPASMPSDTSFFTFQPGSSKAAVLAPSEVREMLSELAFQGQLNPAAKGQPFRWRGKEYYALPSELSEGLIDFFNHQRPNAAVRVATAANSAITHGLLTVPVTNMAYEVKQLMNDFASAMQATAGTGSWRSVLTARGPRIAAKESIKTYARLAGDALLRLLTGKGTNIIRELSRDNLYGVNWESMFEDVASQDQIANVVRDLAVPFGERSPSAKIAALLKFPFKVVDKHGKAREAAFASGIVKAKDTLEPHISHAGNVAAARSAMGGYDKKSELGKLLAPVTQFTKWYTNATANMTTRLARDPVMRNYSLRNLPAGVKASPLIGVLAHYLLSKIWNRGILGEYGAAVEDEVMPDQYKGGFIMPFTSTGKSLIGGLPKDYDPEKDLPVILPWDSNLQIVMSAADAVNESVRGDGGVQLAAEDATRFWLSHLSPPVRVPFEVLTNQKIRTGAPITPEAMNNAASGPDFKTQYALEQFSFAPGFYRRLQNKEATALETAALAGSPFRAIRPTARVEEIKHRYADAWKRSLFAELDKEVPKQDDKRINELLDKLARVGIGGPQLLTEYKGIGKWFERQDLPRDEREELRAGKFDNPLKALQKKK